MNVSRIVLALLLLGAALVMAIEHRVLNSGDPAESGIASSEDFPPVIGNTYMLRRAARQAGPIWGSDPDAAIALIARYLSEYPLETRGWLDLARIEASRHGPDSAMLAPHLEAAVAVRPRSRSTRWQAIQIALQAGDVELAEQHLALWLKSDDRDTERALFIARRWIDDGDELLDRIVPDKPEFLNRAMSFAMNQRDWQLAEAVWRRVEDGADLSDPILLSYVDSLISQGNHERAVEIWSQHDRFYQPGRVANGDFSRPLGAGQGFNWRVGRLPSGASVVRDENEFYFQPASLRVEFDGNHNLRLRAPWIRIPVEPGRRYQLSGYWKADGLTTRALPFWIVEGEGGRINQRVELPDSSFDWTSWSVTFEVPEAARMIRLRLRRDSTSAFDRYIEGQLWLDGIELTLLAKEEIEVDG